MLVNLKLGFRDIWNQKFFFVVCIAFLVLFNHIQLLLPATIYYMNVTQDYRQGKGLKSFDFIYTQYEYVYERDSLVDIARFYANNAVSVKVSNSLSQLYERNVLLVFGDGSIVNPGMVNQDGISVYAYSTNELNSIEILGVDHPIQQIYYSDTVSDDNFYDISTIFVVYQGDAMVEIIDHLAKGRSEVFWELIAETHILGSDKILIENFTDFVTGRLDGLAIKGNFMEGNSYSLYHNFLYFYMVPLIVFLSLTGIISFLLIFRGMLLRMKRDLTIHLQSGARFRDLLIRFFVFYGSIVGISFSCLYFMKLVIDLTKPYVYAFYLITSVSIGLYIALALKRSNLFENLRGDIQ